MKIKKLKKIHFTEDKESEWICKNSLLAWIKRMENQGHDIGVLYALRKELSQENK